MLPYKGGVHSSQRLLTLSGLRRAARRAQVKLGGSALKVAGGPVGGAVTVCRRRGGGASVRGASVQMAGERLRVTSRYTMASSATERCIVGGVFV